MGRWLVTGAGGMLAHDLLPRLAEAGHDVTALSRDDLDITDPAACAAAVQGHDVVELEVLARRHRHPELERGGVFGSYHPSDHFAHGPSVTEACDTGVASPTARRLCHAGRQ